MLFSKNGDVRKHEFSVDMLANAIAIRSGNLANKLRNIHVQVYTLCRTQHRCC